MPGSVLSVSFKSRNSRLLIERFANRIHGFNMRRQSLCDLYDLCEPLDVEVVQKPMRKLHGAAIEDMGFHYIYINSLLSGPLKVIAGFHEFCHLTDHALNVEAFKSTGNLWNLSKFERQAQIIGVIAWMPSVEIEGLSIEQIMREYGVPRNVAEFRLSLDLWG